jgi:ATP-dependent DNA ligase
VLRVEGLSTMENTYRERRRLLEELDLQGAHWCTPPVFEDGLALFASVEEQGLEASSPSRSRVLTAPASEAGSR